VQTSYFVRYQGEEGWAPAIFLKRVNSDESSASISDGKNTLSTDSFSEGKLLALNTSFKNLLPSCEETNLIADSDQTFLLKMFSFF